MPGIKAATPVIQFVSKMDEPIGEPLYLLGIDIFSDQQFRDYQFDEAREEDLSFLKNPSCHRHYRKIGQPTWIKEGIDPSPHLRFKKSDPYHHGPFKDGGACKIIRGKFWPHGHRICSGGLREGGADRSN